jgi:hypothetical protein
LTLFTSSLKYNQGNWALSKFSAQLSNFGTTLGREPQVMDVSLDMGQVYIIHELVKHFRKAGTSGATQSYSKMNITTLSEALRRSKKVKTAVFASPRKLPQFYHAAYLSLFAALLLPPLHIAIHHREGRTSLPAVPPGVQRQ